MKRQVDDRSFFDRVEIPMTAGANAFPVTTEVQREEQSLMGSPVHQPQEENVHHSQMPRLRNVISDQPRTPQGSIASSGDRTFRS